jgi:hypothetical protein
VPYRIPTQGERPIQFEIKGLPEGLKLDAEKGIITGKTPTNRGDHLMTITAKNGHGETSRPFKVVVGNKLALTPPTGWNSWGGEMIMVSDTLMRKATDTIVERGLADVGFQYVGIDDCWMRLNQQMFDERRAWTVKKHAAYDHIGTKTIGPIRDELGNILPNGKFPDMKAMTDYIHSHGLKAGIYSTPGVKTCQEWAGSYGHESADADQYAKWGFDLLKYDQCSGGAFLKRLKDKVPGFQTKDFWSPMLGNADVVNINQDELGHTAEVIRNVDQKETVMLKKLADGSKALAVFNRDAQNEATITVNWADIDECCEREVFDVWRQKSLGTRKGGISVQISPNGVAFFVVKG